MFQTGIQSEKEREGEGERERERERIDTGGARFLRNWSVLYFPGKAFILLVVHRYQWIIQSHAGSAALTLIETRLFSAYLSHK